MYDLEAWGHRVHRFKASRALRRSGLGIGIGVRGFLRSGLGSVSIPQLLIRKSRKGSESDYVCKSSEGFEMDARMTDTAGHRVSGCEQEFEYLDPPPTLY